MLLILLILLSLFFLSRSQWQGSIAFITGHMSNNNNKLTFHTAQLNQLWCKKDWHHIAWVMNAGVLTIHRDQQGDWEYIGVSVGAQSERREEREA